MPYLALLRYYWTMEHGCKVEHGALNPIMPSTGESQVVFIVQDLPFAAWQSLPSALTVKVARRGGAEIKGTQRLSKE